MILFRFTHAPNPEANPNMVLAEYVDLDLTMISSISPCTYYGRDCTLIACGGHFYTVTEYYEQVLRILNTVPGVTLFELRYANSINHPTELHEIESIPTYPYDENYSKRHGITR